MIKGAYGVLLTPFSNDGKVDYGAYERELDFIAASDIEGVFVCGTTGEFVSLSPEQNTQMLEFAAKKLTGRKRLLAGASDPNPEVTIAYMKTAERLGYDAAVICPPYYFTIGQNDIVRYYTYLSSLDICDIVLYKIPMFTNNIERDSFERLLHQKRIIGMKDSSANIKQIAHEADLVARIRPEFSLLGGTDDSLVPSLLAGCVGSMTAFSVILPEVNAEIYRRFNAGRITEAATLNRKYLKLLRLADSFMFPSGYKAIFQQRGFDMGHCQIEDTKGIDTIRCQIDAELKSVLSEVGL